MSRKALSQFGEVYRASLSHSLEVTADLRVSNVDMASSQRRSGARLICGRVIRAHFATLQPNIGFWPAGPRPVRAERRRS